MALLVLFFFWPVLQAIHISLQDYTHQLYAPQFVGLANYQRLFHSANFWEACLHTFICVLGIVPAMMTLPIGMAILLNAPIRGISIFRVLIYLPVIISMVIVGIAWKWLYAHDGLINYGLSFFGIPKINWLVNPDIALYAVMIVIIWKSLAYYMMMYLAHLQSIPQELYEAAEIDGASLWQKHWYVTVPHLRPTIAMVALISTIGCLKIFTEIYVMTRGGPVGSTQTMVYYIYQRAFENLDLGVASAAGLILMMILLVLSVIQIKYLQPVETPKSSKPAKNLNTLPQKANSL
jgi:putative chitobiose transport system permease protein